MAWSDAASPTAVRVMVMADVRLYREGLARLLASHEGLSVVGTGPINERAIVAIATERPDVILLEAAAACGTDILQQLARTVPDAKVVAYGVTDESEQALRCAELGVGAFVSGEASANELIGAIVGLARGEFNCSPRVAALLMRRVNALAAGMAPFARSHRLTSRELGIVALIAEGLSNKEIAGRLGIELCTVKNHVHHILEKLQLTRRAQVAAHVQGAGMVRRVGRPATAAGS
jgi:two-component system, NarL family, nitrate/nitrite response regulator NarL